MRGAASRAAPFDAAWLAPRLTALLGGQAPPAGLVVAWSGGADSTALLLALVELRRGRRPGLPVAAIHVDHGLQPASRRWAAWCRRQARRLGIPLRVRRVRVEREPGESPEAAARRARYRALEEALRPGEALLFAHHARDQLETLLLQLMRGAGPDGLAGMPASRPFAHGRLLRPLLEADPGALRDFLRSRSQEWIEDPSNADASLDRNYLRTEILPRLQGRWPALLRTAGRSLRHLGAVRREAEASARRLLARVVDGDAISLPLLRRLPVAQRAAVLRAWISGAGHTLPDEARLAQVDTLAYLREDAQGRVVWGASEVRVHQDRLVLLVAHGAPDAACGAAERIWPWRRRRAIELPGGTLRIRADERGDLDLDALPERIVLRGRPRGRVRDAGGVSVDVKSLLRESGIPSWQRELVPFLHEVGAGSGEGLLAVSDLWLAPGVRARTSTRNRGRIVWQPK